MQAFGMRGQSIFNMTAEEPEYDDHQADGSFGEMDVSDCVHRAWRAGVGY
jgi:hypothetical protein